MADSLSITVEPSPKVGLPVWHSPMEEAKGSRLRESAIRADTSPSVFQKIVAEILGTFILIFAGCGAALVDKIQTLTIVGIAAVWGLALMALIYALAHVSGAHFNPAVTIAFAAASKFPWKHNTGLAGVAIGATVMFNIIIAGPVTGASMNPARTIGPAIASGVYENLWVFIVAPVLGALAATLVYSLLRVPGLR